MDKQDSAERIRKQLCAWLRKFDQLDIPITASEMRFAAENKPAQRSRRWVRFQGRIVWGFPRY